MNNIINSIQILSLTLAACSMQISCAGDKGITSNSSSSSSSSSTSSSSSSSSSSTSSTSSSSSSGGIAKGNLVLAINSGGEFVKYKGTDFQADQYSRGGTPNSTSDSVLNSDGSALFQTERYGKYVYEVPVSAATYDVDLYFNELFQTATGGRSFSVTVEGQSVLKDFDLFAAVGSNTAYEHTIKGVKVSDGNLTIELTAVVDNGTLAGFAIYSDTGTLEQPNFPIVSATNPNIWADVPDMSIIRVGETYYMSSTTMHLNPGVPIMKSTDLKNWEVINYAHQALDANSNKLNLNSDNAYSKGTWASSINYKNGTFYVTSFSYTTNKTYIWKTNNIEGGSWTQTTINQLMHDSSLLLDDDGRVYIAYGSDQVKLIELNADATAIKSGGVNQVVIQSASAVAGTSFILKAEGTQIQKINGWYYISNICWPSGGPRTQVVHRSRNITGPYEGKVVLRENVNGAGVAQGSYVSTADGKWYLYAFRDSGAVGRIPYLVPVVWQNDWPTPTNGVQSKLDFSVENRGVEGIIHSDEFSNSKLDIVWQWNHNPDANGWSLTQRAGFLRITNTRTDSNIHSTRNTLTQRMYGPTSTGVIKIDVSGLKDGDTAGISAFQDQYGYVGVNKSGNQNYVVMVNNNSTNHSEIARVPLSQNTVYLRIQGDFRNQTDKATFAYSTDNISWTPIGNTVNMKYELTHFMGYRFALFNFGTRSTGGFADFDFFHVSD